MSFKTMMQFGVSFMLLLFSTGAAWYEGSALIEDSFEWKNTAIFSQIVHGSVTNANDLLAIDYFVYAAKFLPMFPLLMLLSGTYLILLIGYFLLKRQPKPFAKFLFLLGLLFLVVSFLISDSPTSGLKIFRITLIPISMMLLAGGFHFIYQRGREVYN